MGSEDTVAEHYASGELWDRLRRVLIADGVDPDAPTVEALAPYDQFHGRGLEATAELADGLVVSPSDSLLDVGCGYGGPARYFANRFSCKVTGIDLTAEFCDLARHLNALTGLVDRISIHEGSALAMPFEDGTFDGVYSMNVSMNIEDRVGLYAEMYRVLRPGGWLVLSEIAQGPNTGLSYPTAWARTKHDSFLLTADATQELLEAAGFVLDTLADTTARTLEAGVRARELVQEGHEPKLRAIGLVHGDATPIAAKNSALGFQAEQLVQIEVRCTRPD